jgi:serine/threonine protein kinase/tetratricopeptide (TPR) repeat protein
MTEETIFNLALAQPSPEERAALLDQACAGQPQLRAAVEALLQAHSGAGSFLEKPPAGAAEATGDDAPDRWVDPANVPPPAPEGPGSRIGPYKLLQRIGEGGMGVVYMAEQEKPVRRRVALKIIKPGMDSAPVVARFEAERQALALMDHHNIARVFDAGTTETGRPYFVMELVHGIPITQYCDDNHLTPRERLELFVAVCQAVQHAHQKGVIHRDLKPSNVLVCLYDGKPVPKVIDFGVAKATEQRLTEKTMFTQFGTVIGTLEYMSPEQAEMSQLGIDTRSDIYSLGVLLYELLTGTTPLERKRLREAALDEVFRIIREEEPPKPSTRLSSSGRLPGIAAARKTEPAKLSKLVRGELDWIVMKALEKDRSRRYETANGLARDIQRYLADEPVEACPPSTGYRLRKFVRKHRAGISSAAALAALLLLGIAVSTWQAVRATRAEAAARANMVESEKARAAEAEQRRLAEDAAEAETQAKEKALAREAETQAVLEFVENKVFAAARPEGQAGGLGREVTLRRAIEDALPYVDQNFRDQPLIEARLRMTLGSTFAYLGERKIAADQHQAARTLYTKHLGPDHPDTLRSMSSMARSYYALGRSADALKLHEETLALQRDKLGPEHRETLRSMHGIASCYFSLGRYADAIKLHEETLALQKAKLGPDHPDTLSSMISLAYSYDNLRQLADALKLREESLALRKAKFGPDHPDTLVSMGEVAKSYAFLGRITEALKLRQETLALQRAKLGPDHPSTLRTMFGLAGSYQTLGRHVDALKLREETVALQKVKLGPDHPDTLRGMTFLAGSYYHLERVDDALKLYEETLALQKTKHGLNFINTLVTMNNLAWILATASDVKYRDPSRAVELAKKAAELSPRHTVFWGTYGTALYRTGDWKGAIAALEKEIGLRTPDHPNSANEGFFLAMSYWQLGEKDKAREWFA